MTMGKQTYRCGLYFRVSTEEQAAVQEGSIKNQRARLTRFISQKNENIFGNSERWLNIREYSEEGRSAKDTNRPLFRQMIQDIKDGTINTVLFTELSRISRSTSDFLEFGKFLQEHNADFICLQHPELNTATAHGRILLTLLVAMMEFEREINVDRSRRSYEERAGRGLWTGSQLFGYDLMEGRKGYLTVNETEANVVRFIFRAYLKERSVHKVVALCNQRGYKTKSYTSRRKKYRGGGDFTYSSVKQILNHYAYIGMKEINKRNKGKKDVAEGRGYRVIKSECWTPIIKPEIFNRAQQILNENAKTKGTVAGGRGSGYPFLLGNLVTCHHCEAILTHGGAKRNGILIPHYIHRKKQQLARCPIPANLSAKKLDQAIWARLLKEAEEQLPAQATEEYLSAYAAEAIPKDMSDLRTDLAETERAIKTNQDEYDNIIKSLGGSPEKAGNRVVGLLKELSDDIDALKAQRDEQERRLKTAQAGASVDAQLKRILKNKKRSIARLPPAQKVDLAKALLSGIILRPDAIILNRRFGKPIVGTVMERPGVRSSKWRFVAVEWLN